MINRIDALNYRVDGQSPEEWEQILGCFDDANIYQTNAYARICYGEGNISTLVIRRGNDPIAAALVRIRKVPGLPMGMAYVRWGPIWRKNGIDDYNHLSQGLRELSHEYVTRRGLFLRIRPFLYDDESLPHGEKSFQTEGYKAINYWPKRETLLIDLNKPLEDLRKGLKGKWRGHLNKAKRNKMTVIEGTDDELFVRFQPIHKELLNRKRLTGIKDVEVFRKIQVHLPDKFKMKVFLCEHLGRVCAGILVSSIGKIGHTLSRATSNLGRNSRAAYLVQWQALKWLKEQGCDYYDLSGVNAKLNPGTYSYKLGLCGKNGRQIKRMYQYEKCNGRLNRAMFSLLNRGLIAIRR